MLFVSFVFTSWRNTAISGRQRQPIFHLRRKSCHPSPEYVSEHVCFDTFFFLLRLQGCALVDVEIRQKQVFHLSHRCGLSFFLVVFSVPNSTWTGSEVSRAFCPPQLCGCSGRRYHGSICCQHSDSRNVQSKDHIGNHLHHSFVLSSVL